MVSIDARLGPIVRRTLRFSAHLQDASLFGRAGDHLALFWFDIHVIPGRKIQNFLINPMFTEKHSASESPISHMKKLFPGLLRRTALLFSQRRSAAGNEKTLATFLAAPMRRRRSKGAKSKSSAVEHVQHVVVPIDTHSRPKQQFYGRLCHSTSVAAAIEPIECQIASSRPRAWGKFARRIQSQFGSMSASWRDNYN